jgi:hypothetical protein
MSKIAFLGLGHMGTPMAIRLLDTGHAITVWNRTIERTEPLADAGATVAASPAEAVAGVEFAITMLANPEALGDVLFGWDGLAGALATGQTLIDMSTIGPDAFRSAATRLPCGVVAPSTLPCEAASWRQPTAASRCSSAPTRCTSSRFDLFSKSSAPFNASVPLVPVRP